MSKISAILGYEREAQDYQVLSDSIKESIKKHFYHEDTAVFDRGKQGANAFAAELGLCDERSIRQLVEYYTSRGHFDTGIFGTPVLAEMLFELGHGELAVKLLTAEGYPGFAHWRKIGATTLHESWDSHDSHSHPMFGGVVGVLMRQLAGIRPDESCPGFRHIHIQPCFVRGLDYVKANTLTGLGAVSVEWSRSNGQIKLSVTIPSNASASLILSGSSTELSSGTHAFTLQG